MNVCEHIEVSLALDDKLKTILILWLYHGRKYILYICPLVISRPQIYILYLPLGYITTADIYYISAPGLYHDRRYILYICSLVISRQ